MYCGFAVVIILISDAGVLLFFSGRPFPTLMVTPVFRSLFSPRSYIKKKPQTASQSRS